MFLAAANRDPRRWERPEDYDIARRTSGHVGFGAGIHMCVGQLLARLEGEVLLAALARRVRAIEIAGTPVRRYNNTLRGLASLPLALRAAEDPACPNITFIHPDGSRQEIEADAGSSVMQAATAEGLEEILAECGGNCMCATCHVYVAADQLAALPAPTPDEDALLDGTAAERRPNSRLSCQCRRGKGWCCSCPSGRLDGHRTVSCRPCFA